ncbi:hypothetical protein MBSD_n2660 [Mizugakiibacter sediminis]|uniref:Quercetin 2,3-dioxygenase n=1 Tax=Mizugakiibacter sediminis TaxID=1475481 RepID=A0A0K8QQZ1_9GAMM|nr:pirin-like bicupin family protein [Mizugakiibacter sediminis]GAP67339.1 hypothetical protein MBSD_n2660 [Mizugakiibacter sediminis]
MPTLRPAAARGHTRTDWLDSRHSFSFGRYYEPAQTGFRALRVLNEDVVAPGSGFPPHHHANMEILTWVLEGALAHRDSAGGSGVIRAGELQRMSAGHGIEHSEYNAADDRPVRFLQIWIQPNRVNLAPSYAQRAFAAQALRDRLCLLAAPAGAGGDALALHADAHVYAARLGAGAAVRHRPAPGRGVWVQVARGEVTLDGTRLTQGDGAALDAADALTLTGGGADGGEVLLFELA